MTIAGATRAETNLGFEAADTSGWSALGAAGATDSYGPFSPVSGGYFGYVEGGAKDTYATLSRSFDLLAGEVLSGWVGFRANDVYEAEGLIFNDDGYLAIDGVNLFARSVLDVGDYGSTGWVQFSFKAVTAGTYMLEIGAANRGDDGFASGVVLDDVTVSGIPEPRLWALLLAGFGGLGGALRARRVRMTAPG